MYSLFLPVGGKNLIGDGLSPFASSASVRMIPLLLRSSASDMQSKKGIMLFDLHHIMHGERHAQQYSSLASTTYPKFGGTRHDLLHPRLAF